MSFLLDTNVISELRRPEPSARVVDWLRARRDHELYLSVVTVAELERGVAGVARRSPRRARELRVWVDGMLTRFGARIIGVSVTVARTWGRLAATQPDALADMLVAATALEHRLTLVTRNTADFRHTGVETVDPFNA